MKTPRFLLAATLLLPLAGCDTTTPAQRYAQSQQLVAQAYSNKLSPAQQAALATAIYQQAEATRATQQAQSAAIIAQGFQNAGNTIANSSRQQQPYYVPYQPSFQPVPIPQAPVQNYQIDTPAYQRVNGASPGNIHY